ncbi:MAG: LPS export ABC transporter periplasmic protein LptC [Burkholderiales bacterium]|nr:LPS export ABC transporter periplasmic protein LptC [Burkholderiales bacterium]
MIRRLASWFPLALLGALAAVAFWLEYTVQPPITGGNGKLRHDPDYIIENFSALRMGEDGHPLYKLAAEKLIHYPDDDTSHLQEPDFVHYDPETAPLRITSDTALVTGDGENAYFSDDVRVVREPYARNSELTITTDYLHVIPEKHLAKTDKPVTMVEANTTIKAVGLEFDNEARTVKLLSRVNGRYEQPSSD